MEDLTELRKHVSGSKLVLGTAEVLKLLKQGKLAKVFVASNALPAVNDSLDSLKADCEVVRLEIPNDELGVLCKKPFSIAVVGVLR